MYEDVTDIMLSTVNIGKYNIYFSDRGIPLLYNSKPLDRPILTVENYSKWYKLFLIMPDGSVEIDKNYYEHWVDHCPVPMFLEKYCEEHDFILPDETMEIILGRYLIEKREDIVYNKDLNILKLN